MSVRSDKNGSGMASTFVCVQVCDDRPDRGGAELAKLLQLIPPDKLMIETDGPYLVPRTIKPAKARPRRCATRTAGNPSRAQACPHREAAFSQAS